MKPIDEGGGGLKQTPETFGAINLGNLDADPSTATSNIGDVYYNTTSNTIKALFTDSLGGLTWNNVAYGINIDKTQVVGTAVTLADSGTITSAMIGNTQVTLSKLSTGSVNNSKVATNADIDPTKIAGTAAILGANTFIDQQTITPATSVTALMVNAASSAVGLVVKLGASGSANLQEWQNNSGTALSYVGASGFFFMPRLVINTDASARLNVGTTGTTQVGAVIRGIASQTADLQQWQDSGSAVRAQVSSAGAFTISPSAGTALTVNAAASGAIGLQVNTQSGGGDAARFYHTNATVYSAFDGAGRLLVRTTSTVGNLGQPSAGIATSTDTTIGLVIRGASTAQTADLQQLQASSGTVLGGRNALAQIYSGSTAPMTVATGGAISGTSSGTTATLTSASAHGLAVGDLVTIAGMTPSGYNGTYLVATVPTTTTFTVTTSGSNLGNSTVSGTASVPAQASITARSAGTIGLQLRAAASQVANIMRIEDSSGTTLLRVTSAGNLQASNVMSLSSLSIIGEANSGGQLTMTRQTAAAGNPGANIGRLYFRDGTNANTLKLVVRAGAAGAETTILDNIPT